jgi:hypothetical protein
MGKEKANPSTSTQLRIEKVCIKCVVHNSHLFKCTLSVSLFFKICNLRKKRVLVQITTQPCHDIENLLHLENTQVVK